MIKGRHIFSGVTLLGWALVCAQAFGQMVPGVMLPNDLPPDPKKPKLTTNLPSRPSLPASFQIPVTPLSFAPPASFSYYLGRKNSLVSLDFLDENRLLFSFHAAGLHQRETGDAEGSEARQMRAVVIALPEGKIEGQASWTVPDHFRYLWMLKDGEFLLRTPDGLEQGDRKLEMKPLPRLPGQLLSVALSPGQEVMVTTSKESAPQSQTAGASGASPMTAARLTPGGETSGEQSDLVVRVIQRPSDRVLQTQRVHSAFNEPMNAEGYVALSSAKKYVWKLTLKSFDGGSKVLSIVDSGCPPNLGFITDRELFLTTCTPEGGLRLAGLSTGGHTFWATDAPPEPVWPLLVMSPDGSRLAREALVLKNSVDLKKHPKFVEAVKGQVVRVLDAANGKMVFEAPLTPILDGGGNVAFSPSGRRFAILNGGAIQVFDLPPAAPTPDLSKDGSAH